MKLYTYRDGSQAWLDDAEYKEALKADTLSQIEQCKSILASTDYKAIKYAEGLISDADYAPIKAERQALRDRINELEKEL